MNHEAVEAVETDPPDTGLFQRAPIEVDAISDEETPDMMEHQPSVSFGRLHTSPTRRAESTLAGNAKKVKTEQPNTK